MLRKGILAIAICAIMSSILLYPQAGSAQTANLYFVGAPATAQVGDTFSVSVVINTNGIALDTARVRAVYPADKLKVKSFSQGALFPNKSPGSGYDNSSGSLSWGGFEINGGVIGSGTFGTAVFEVIGPGAATVSLTSQSHLISEGQEMINYGSLGTFTVNIGGTPPEPEPTPEPVPEPEPVPTPQPEPTPEEPKTNGETKHPEAPQPTPESSPEPTQKEEPEPTPDGSPNAPFIFSGTHPDTEKWYADSNPEFSWALSSDITGVNILMDRDPQGDPGTRSDGLFDEYTYRNVEDGEWYFHIRLRNRNGWGKTAHFPVLIDTEVPSSFEVEEAERSDSTFPYIGLRLRASDATSGISHFEIRIDDGDPIVWEDDGTGRYLTPRVSAGDHIVTVRAVDYAGNSLQEILEVHIEPGFSSFFSFYTPFSFADDSFWFTLGSVLGQYRRVFTVLLVILLMFLLVDFFLTRRAIRARKAAAGWRRLTMKGKKGSLLGGKKRRRKKR